MDTIFVLKFPRFLYLGGVFLLFGISLFITIRNYFEMPVIFILVGIAMLLGSNMVFKKGRIELTEQHIEFFNQLGFKFRNLSIDEINAVHMNDNKLTIHLESGKSVTLHAHNYSEEILFALAPILKSLSVRE